jgi:hypothetical protein
MGQSCHPVFKQDEDICDFLLDHGSHDTGNIEPAVTGMIHSKVHAEHTRGTKNKGQ